VPVPVRSFPAAMQELQSERCDVLIADTAFAADGRLRAAVRTKNQRAQLVLLRGAEDQSAPPRDTVCLIRPVDQAMLLCHVAMAIAEGRPPRRSGRKRVVPLDAIAAGMPAQLIEVSNEGVRLELPNGRTALPPSFTMRVPLLGITLSVQRIWMNSAPEAKGLARCGGALHHLPAQVQDKWRAFVDALPTR